MTTDKERIEEILTEIATLKANISAIEKTLFDYKGRFDRQEGHLVKGYQDVTAVELKNSEKLSEISQAINNIRSELVEKINQSQKETTEKINNNQKEIIENQNAFNLSVVAKLAALTATIAIVISLLVNHYK